MHLNQNIIRVMLTYVLSTQVKNLKKEIKNKYCIENIND